MAMKRNHRGGAQNDQTSRRSTGTTAQIPRPGTADPRSTAHQEQKLFSRRSMNREVNSTNLIAPVPVQASRPHLSLLADSQSFSGTTAFKTPALAISAPQSDKNQTSDAHIPTSAVEFPFKTPQARLEIPSRQSTSPEASAIPTSDTIAETDVPIETSAMKFSLSHPAGPQRLLINRESHYSQKQGELEPLSGHIINESGRIVKSVNIANKRSRDEMDDSDVEADLDGGQPTKRLKIQNSDDRRGRDEYSTRSKVRSPPQSSPRHASEYGHPGESPEARTISRSHHHQNGRSSPPIEERYSYRPEHEHVSPEPRLLDSLLGKDVDSYLKEHMAMYDKSVARWTECEMSEWVAGAGEIAEKYGRILDFVKSHMTAKLKLYSGFHRKVDDHNVILQEREQVLDAARKRLVKESGNVLG